MYEEQARINATISYFFLGPIFLLARNGSPLTDPYVRIHAKRASYTMAFGFLWYIVYFFLKPFLELSIFSLTLSSLLLWAIITTMVSYLMYFAYKAYHWDMLTWTIKTWVNTSFLFHIDAHEKTDAEKIRIIASYIPLLGIWISSKYNDELILMWRKVSSFAFLLIVSTSLFLDESTWLSLIFTLLTVILIVFSWVSLFMTGSFPIFLPYKWIPSYEELKAHLKASLTWSITMIKILGWAEKSKTYDELFSENLSQITAWVYKEPLMVSPRIIGIPYLNLVTVPSLFQEKYKEYVDVVLQWLLLTILFAIVWIFFGFGSDIQLFLFIPMIHLMSFAHISPFTRAPWIDVVISISSLFRQWKTKLEAVKAKEQSVSYSYPKEEVNKL